MAKTGRPKSENVKKEVPCMGYARKDVEKTKKIAKKN